MSLLGIYLLAKRRREVFGFAFGYYLGASRGLLLGAHNYFGDWPIAMAIWLGTAFFVAMVWAFAWHKSIEWRTALLPTVILVLILPPIGYISWVNPIMVAGLVFPGTKLIGMALIIIAVWALVHLMKSKSQKLLALILFCTVAAIAAVAQIRYERKIPVGIEGVDTKFCGEVQNITQKIRRLNYIVARTNKIKSPNALFAEGFIGFWSPVDQMAFNGLWNGKKVYLGAYVGRNIDDYENVLLEVTNSKTKIIYRQRVPAPISMWGNGAKAHLSGSGVVWINGKKTGILICYEQLIAPTALWTYLQDPVMVLAPSNLWWSPKSIWSIQRQNLELWGRLFNIPYIMAVNTPCF